MNKVKIIKLRFGIDKVPIWLSDRKDGTPFTGIDIIDNDKIIKEINLKIIKMVVRYYTFDKHGIPVDYNDELEEKEIEILIDLMSKLNKRFEEINDGTFYIQDYITPKYENIIYFKEHDENESKYLVNVYYDLDLYPIYYNYYLEKIDTGIKQIDNDKIIKTLNNKLNNLVEKVFTFEIDTQEDVYDKDFEKNNKELIIQLYKQLFERLNKLNDGSFTIIDRVSKRLGVKLN